MKRTILLSALVVAGGLTALAFQQPAAGTQAREVTVEKVKDNLYVMRGGGGNSAVFITASGVVVVDTKNPGWGQPLLDKIKTVTDKPVTTIINTHTHGDHVSGNVEFPATVDVVTHINTAENMKEMRPVTGLPPPATGPAPNIFKQNNGRGMAKRTFKDKMTLGKGADQIDLYYFGRAHTGGDAYVVFPAHRIMHAGDTFPNKDLPIMDSNNGGSGVDYAATLTKASQVPNIDTVINGHTPANSTHGDLKEYAMFIRDFVTYVQAGKKAGKSVDEVVAGWQTPAKYANYNPKPARLKSDVEVIFAETK
jgi:cyclase